MRLGEIANAAAATYGKPLDGVRVLALEQMQALPYATQLLARLGADVVKVEHPVGGESRSRRAARDDRSERDAVGATFLRNNLNKRSVAIDLKPPRGRELVLQLAPHFDVVAENFKPGTLTRLGLGVPRRRGRAPDRDLRLGLRIRREHAVAVPSRGPRTRRSSKRCRGSTT